MPLESTGLHWNLIPEREDDRTCPCWKNRKSHENPIPSDIPTCTTGSTRHVAAHCACLLRQGRHGRGRPWADDGEGWGQGHGDAQGTTHVACGARSELLGAGRQIRLSWPGGIHHTVYHGIKINKQTNIYIYMGVVWLRVLLSFWELVIEITEVVHGCKKLCTFHRSCARFTRPP